MKWYTWASLLSSAYIILRKPAAAEGAALPVPPVIAVPKGQPKPSVPPAPKPTQPVVKVATVNGRQYTVTRATHGLYQVALISDPSVFQDFDQTGVLRESGDPAKLAQLKLDEQQFPAGLFQS